MVESDLAPSLAEPPGHTPPDQAPLRILASHYLADPEHAAARAWDEICAAIRALGHQVVVHRSAGPAAHQPPATVPSDSTQSGRALQGLRNTFWFSRALARNRAMTARDRQALLQHRPDIVLARADAYCYSMPKAARRAGVPLITYADAPVAHETRSFCHRTGRWHPPGLVETIERNTLRQSLAVLTISHPAAQLLASYQVGRPIDVAPNGIDPARFPKLDPAQRAAGRSALGLTAPRVAGFSGTFQVFHGLDHLLKLIQSLAHRRDTQWLLVGDGPEGPALRAALRERADVVFTGRRPREEVGRLLGLMDVAIAPPPQLEGPYYFCPMRVIEYAASGCAVVAQALGDIPRLLDGRRAGVVLDTADLPQWRDAVDALLDDPDHCAKLGQAARQWIHGHHTWRHTAAAITRTLTSALATRSQSHA
jgi:glycosyltransferase involved in cell wall biosynthesis